jgi:hypothetical protein
MGRGTSSGRETSGMSSTSPGRQYRLRAPHVANARSAAQSIASVEEAMSWEARWPMYSRATSALKRSTLSPSWRGLE